MLWATWLSRNIPHASSVRFVPAGEHDNGDAHWRQFHLEFERTSPPEARRFD
jgi:hypothetical protein